MSILLGRAVRAVAIVCAVGSTAACATVTRGVHQTWSVETTPAGAQVKTSNGFACDQTPCTFKMERKTTFDVTISKPGYKTWTGHVHNQLAAGGGAGFLGNAMVGGVIGAGVDVTSGAMLDLKPNPLQVTLEKDDATASASPAAPVAEAAASPAPGASAPKR